MYMDGMYPPTPSYHLDSRIPRTPLRPSSSSPSSSSSSPPPPPLLLLLLFFSSSSSSSILLSVTYPSLDP